MSGRPFNLTHALANWQMRFPDVDERIQELRKELASCRAAAVVARKSGKASSGGAYPQTEKNIERMLEALEAAKLA